MTLTFNPRHSKVVTRTRRKTLVQRSVGSEKTVETNGRTYGWTDTTDCFTVLAIRSVKLEFHDADTDMHTDILARILADTSDTRDFLKLFLWQAERHADILATILARMSVSLSVSAPWNASLTRSVKVRWIIGRCDRYGEGSSCPVKTVRGSRSIGEKCCRQWLQVNRQPCKKAASCHN